MSLHKRVREQDKGKDREEDPLHGNPPFIKILKKCGHYFLPLSPFTLHSLSFDASPFILHTS
jgi:hypothetical protein